LVCGRISVIIIEINVLFRGGIVKRRSAKMNFCTLALVQ
jgi:hypothetical protein